jgi:UDP-glucose 4-epimerase
MKKQTKDAQLKKKVIVTGGAGFIGSHLVDALIERGFDVHAIDNLSGGKKENVNRKATLHVVDIRDAVALKKIFGGTTYVFHCAALPRVQRSIENPELTNDVNINGTLAVLVASRDARVKKVVYSASSSAYGDQTTFPLHEGLTANPKSPYGLQKYVGELYAKMFFDIYQLPTVSLRYFSVYGPRFSVADGAYMLVLGMFLKQRMEGKPMTITGDGKQTRDFTHVRDVVRANILAAESAHVGKGEVINIGAGKNQTINKIAEFIGGPIEYVPARLEPHDTLADNKRARKLLGWKPEVAFSDGIAELKQIFGIA